MQWPWSKAESDLDRELRFHVESMAEAFERDGVPPREALRRARREFGGMDLVREQCRDESRWRWLAGLRQDLTFGWRMLRKTPVVTAAAVLSLALGIGATTAILSVVEAVLWRSLPVPHPEQLTEVFWQSRAHPDVFRGSSGGSFPDGPYRVGDFFSQAAFQNMRRHAGGRAAIAAHMYPTEVSASFEGRNAVTTVRPVSGNFFAMLGVTPALGRLLAPADDHPAAPPAVVVSHQFWQSSLRGEAAIAGRPLRVNGRTYQVAGVLPAAFGGIVAGDTTGLYTALAHNPELHGSEDWLRKNMDNPDSWAFQILVRRAPGVTNEMLRAQLDPLFRSAWPRQPAKPESAPSIRLQDASGGLGGLRREFTNPLYVLTALVGLVLLIACANIANLLLARAGSRRKEVALRVSLGCGRGRLVRQFFTESAMLAALGGLLSLGVAYATANFAVTLIPSDGRGLNIAFSLDWRTLAATVAVTLLATLAFGLYPALRASHVPAAAELKEGSALVPSGGRSWLAPGKLLILAQVAFAVLLITAAAAFTSHLRRILSADAGFDRTRLLLFDLRPGQSGYSGARLRQFYFDAQQRLRDLPGVEAVGLARIRPMRGGGYFDTIRVEGGAGKGINTALNFVTADYLRALGVPLLAGRPFSELDLRSGAAVAVVSEDLAREIGPQPLGKAFVMEDRRFEVIGVAARARYSRLTQQQNVLYVPNAMVQESFTVVMRTAASPWRLVSAVRAAVGELDRGLPLVDVVTMEEQIANTLLRERLFAWLCGAFGVLALVLCMVGLYGVMSYAAARRSHEIAIRMALGASRGSVLRRVLGEGLAPALLGVAAGAPAAWWAAGRFVDYRRLDMDPLDPSTLAAAAALLALCAVVAVLAPALRASAADPSAALRQG